MCISGRIFHTFSQFNVTLEKFGININRVTENKPEAFAAAIDEYTKVIYVESIGNPKYNLYIAVAVKVCVGSLTTSVPLILRC